ncbi:MAG: putative Ig domain-containing protein [Elainellaceae cyanobacterium]
MVLPSYNPIGHTLIIGVGEAETNSSGFENDGNLDNLGDFINNSIFENDSDFDNDGTFDNNGDFDNDGIFINDNEFVNNGTFENDFYGDFVNNDDFLNNSTFINKRLGDFFNNGTFENDDFFENKGDFVNSNTFINSSTFISSRDFINDGSFINNGSFANSGTFTNNGLLAGSGSYSGTALTINSGTFRPEGFTVGANFTLSGSGTLAFVEPGSGTLLTVSGNTQLSGGAITFDAGQLSGLDEGSFTLLDGQGSLTVAGSLLDDVDSFDTAIRDYELVVDSNDLLLTVEFLNVAPTDLDISSAVVDENAAVGTIVGSFSSTDLNVDDSFTYELVSGDGSSDNSAFTINGDQLHLAVSPDFETQSTETIRVRTTDAAGESYEEVLTIAINNLNEVPTLATTIADQAIFSGDSFVQDVSDSFVDVDADDALSYSVSGLPSGINLDSSTGEFSGSTSTLGVFDVTVTATDMAGASVSDTFELTVSSSQATTDDDLLLLDALGVNTVDGDSGNDTIIGIDGDDILHGSAGDDLLNGGAGSDAYFGDGGIDTFVLQTGEGFDIVADFEQGTDQIELFGLSFGQISTEFSEDKTHILFGDDVLAELQGAVALVASDFAA